MKAVFPPMPARYRDLHYEAADGLRLHYRDYAGAGAGAGDRPPLLCLHGLTRNARDFAQFAERYSADRRVIVPDFRGRGQSDYDPQPERYTPLVYASDMLQLMDRLAVDEVVFVGTSLGGLVTMAIAAMAPQRIAATILNDVGPDVSPSGVERILSYVGKDRRFKSWDEAAVAVAEIQRASFRNYTHDEWVAMAKRNCREEDGEIRFDYDMAIAEPFKSLGATPAVDLWPFFEALARKPLLVIRGEKSDLLTAETASKMQQVAPAMKLAIIAGIGHAPELSEPEAVAAIDEFLAAL